MSKQIDKKVVEVIELHNTASNLKSGDDYYQMEHLIKTKLNDILSDDELLDMTKHNLHVMLKLCSSYRPQEPWRILLIFSMAMDKKGVEL